MQNSIKQGVNSPNKSSVSGAKNQETTEFVHVYIRGNYRQDIFFDKVDYINAWNRLWLSAFATGVEIFAAEFLSNHLHLCIKVVKKYCARVGGLQLSNFIHHFRMSLSAYFNRRYNVHGSLGSRRYGAGHVIDIEIDGGEDLRDLIRYILRNVTHHGIEKNYSAWPFSTYSFVFGLFEKQTARFEDIPEKVQRAFTPSSALVPKDWLMTKEGMIIPPEKVFRCQEIESIFINRNYYINACSIPSRRETNKKDESNERLVGRKLSVSITDQDIIDYVGQHSLIPIVSMTKGQIKDAVLAILKEFPKASTRQLSRILHVPASTVGYWIGHS